MKEQKKNILERYMQGLINEEEYNEFSQMVLDENDEKIFDLMDECICKNTNAYVMPSDVKLNLYDRIWEQIRKENIRVRLRKISSLAASILLPLFIFSTVYFYFQVDEYKHRPNVIVAENGQKAEFTLPDGSKVHLNGGSKLSYNAAYNGRLREVSLEGEAFFDVKQDKEKPFIVKTSVFDVEVLGTSFNVSAYDDEDMSEITLVEGKVKLSLNNSDDSPVYLTPSQKFVYSKNGKEGHISFTDEEYELAWKKGVLMFNAELIENVFQKIERWYGVSIHYESDNIIHDRFTGEFEALTIQEMMNILRMHYNFKYKIENNDIYII
ncbi:MULTISPECIES: FecR family protein [Barnesiella]|jgi:putative sigma factor regulatory protein, fecR/pupR family|uniref:FecR family protein n=1 Tax=Barnesiella TaxID=397864 RepID=UPI000E4B1DAC|nr:MULTISPECIES: FecR family protein [Barnesiella]MBT9844383.1 DUF4974 domain-containing protein [Barnesiella intestinihominis]RHR96063.1 FecR family protein [Bacteroides sp. AF14-46]HBB50277.1 FecR family protein [Barnesiella sp.]